MKSFLKGTGFPDNETLDFQSEVLASGSTHRLLQTRSPELHKTLGKVYNSWWCLCRERLITVPSFVCLSLSEVCQGKSLMNAQLSTLNRATVPNNYHLHRMDKKTPRSSYREHRN